MKNIMKEQCGAVICTGCQKKLAGIEKKVKIMRIWRWCMVLCTILLLWSGELRAQVSLPKDPAVTITIRKKNDNSTYTLGAFSDIPEDAEVAVQSFNEKIVSIQYVDKYGDSEDVDNGDAYGISDGIKQSGGTWKTGDFVLCAHRQGTTDSFSQKDPYSNPFKKIQFGGKSENYSGLFNYRINVSSGKGLSKSQAKALQGQQTMYIEMKEGYELVKVESFVSAMAGGTGRNALTKSKQGNGYQIRLSATLEDGKTYPGAYSRIIITCKKEGKGYSKREFEIYP